MPAIRTEDDGAVRHLVLCRPDEYNTITPELRDELTATLDAADDDHTVRVVLLRAEGPAFCSGYGLDWSTAAQATEEGRERAWDSMADLRMIGRFAAAFARLHTISKPTIAAVHGWCIAGGTDLVLNADLIIAGESARFGYPPARVWGIPEAPWLWVARLGLEQAKRYLLTGDEITAEEGARLGLVLECVPDADLRDRASVLAQRMAQLPLNQLQMLKLVCNDVAAQMYRPETSRLLGTLFDGVARHTQEGPGSSGLGVSRALRRSASDRGPVSATPRVDDPFGD